MKQNPNNFRIDKIEIMKQNPNNFRINKMNI